MTSNGEKQPTLNSILVATDFSETAGRAVERTCDLARQHAAKIVLVHAVTTPKVSVVGPQPVMMPRDIEEMVLSASQERLDETAARLREQGLAIETVFVSATPSHTILQAAEAHAVDLIVIGTRGLSGFEHLMLGSTAEQVVRKASCPVLTIHPEDRASIEAPRTVIVPTELSEDPTPAVHEVIRLLVRPEKSARVLLVYSEHLPAYLQPFVSDLGLERIGFDAVREELGGQLAPVAARLESLGYEVETLVEQGEPATVITQLASERSAELIAMETRGRSGLAQLLQHSTAERVVQHASCPVLTLRRSATQ
jgi:nucleotide-binding universal stress UspA family protein